MEALSGKVPFVKTWVHAGFLTIDGRRMGKSMGNFITIRDVAAKGYDGAELRTLFLQSHYRSELNFSWDLLDAAKNRYQTWTAAADMVFQLSESRPEAPDLEELFQAMLADMANDLDTPHAIMKLDAFAAAIEQGRYPTIEQLGAFLAQVDSLLGLRLSNRSDITDEAKQLIKQRTEARTDKDWALSDSIRDELMDTYGIAVKDTPGGQTYWTKLKAG